MRQTHTRHPHLHTTIEVKMNTYEDDEFNRIEMESRVRQEYVRQQLKKQQDDIPTSIPFITPEDWEAVLKNN